MQKLSTDEVEQKLAELNQLTKTDWAIAINKIIKVFAFEDFDTAFKFMTLAAAEAEKLDHHPDWCNSYNKVTVELTTHSAGGLSELDFSLATAMEKISAELA